MFRFIEWKKGNFFEVFVSDFFNYKWLNEGKVIIIEFKVDQCFGV